MKAIATSIHIPIAVALGLCSALAAWSQPAGNPPSHVPRGFVQVPERSQFNRLPPNVRKRLRLAANPGFGAVQTAAETGHVSAGDVLYSFEGNAPKGDFPYGGLIRDEDGNLYGATSGGGTGYADAGVVYKVDPRGRESVLYSFTGGADGSGPTGTLLRDRAGELYGATQSGGARGAGVVYKVSPSGRETVLYSFSGPDGDNPFAGLISDGAGNLYGITLLGGSAGAGVAFKLDPSGNETVLHSFTGGADGAYPTGALIRDSAGNLYGTANGGGNLSACGGFGCGLVFKLDSSGNETILYTFTGATDGAYPSGSVTLDTDGNLYGTTDGGGDLNACFGGGCGVVFKIDTKGNETALYAFAGTADGNFPNGGLILDGNGNLYGTTNTGGDLSGCFGAGCGVIFKVDRFGNQIVLHTFHSNPDGANPNGNLIRDTGGNLYGTAGDGGALNFGVVYKLDGAGKETMLYSFPSSPRGSTPFAGVIRGGNGELYGTAFDGGLDDSGVVYKVDAQGKETILYTFTGGADGGFPDSVIRDDEGNLYGTAGSGGDLSGCNNPYGCGLVYKLDSQGNQTVLYTFTGGSDGAYPYGSLVRDAGGNLYGTAGGGAANWGVVYKLSPAGQETVLHTFTGGLDGGLPFGSLVRDSGGNLYGTTTFGGAGTGFPAGVIFKLDPSGKETVLHNFQCYDPTNGCQPHAGLVRDDAGNFYGTTFFGGGPLDSGVVFKLDTTGKFTVLHTFACGSEVASPCGPDGGNPYDGVIRDSAGNLYGTTSAGGDASQGIAYKLDPAGNETVLHSFTGGADGGQPSSGLLDIDGYLYGTAPRGGNNGGGVIFKLPAQ